MNSESKTKISVLAAAFLAVSGLSVLPAMAQLPPTNMGKFVHKPGDNQYSDATQSTRHPAAPPPIISRPMGGGGGGGGSIGYTPTRPKPKPDISLQAIPADEPIAPAGFPPLPESVDLPGVNMVTALNAEDTPVVAAVAAAVVVEPALRIHFKVRSKAMLITHQGPFPIRSDREVPRARSGSTRLRKCISIICMFNPVPSLRPLAVRADHPVTTRLRLLLLRKKTLLGLKIRLRQTMERLSRNSEKSPS